MRLTKLILFSVVLLILLLPTSCSTWITINSLIENNSYINPEFVKSDFYTSNDEIGFYTEWCKNNNFGGRIKGTVEEKLSECIDAELRIQGVAFAFDGFNQLFTLIILPLFIIYLIFFIWWTKRNYSKKS
jgi:hypothetical protein